MISLSDETYEDFIGNSDIPVLVDFWADWCQPCEQMKPILEELSDELDGKITFTKVNTDEETPLIMDLQINSIPTVLIYSNGEMVKRITGAKNKLALMKELEEWL